MTEAEWLAGTDPSRMIQHLCDQGASRRKAGKRKFTLLTCAFSSSAFCAGNAFNRFSLAVIRSAASCLVCGFASPPAVNAPIAVSSTDGGGAAAAT